MRKRRNSILCILEHIIEYITGILFIALVSIMVLQVFFRYILNNSLFWADEFSRFALVFIVMFGATLAVKHEEHITTDVGLFSLFPAQIERLRKKFTDVLIIVFLLIIIYKGIELSLILNIRKSPALHIPLGYLIGIIPLNGILMLLFIIFPTIDRIRNRKGD